MNLHNMFYVINYVNIYACEYISIMCWNWHHAFHMHWGNLEIRCECIVEIDTALGV